MKRETLEKLAKQTWDWLWVNYADKPGPQGNYRIGITDGSGDVLTALSDTESTWVDVDQEMVEVLIDVPKLAARVLELEARAVGLLTVLRQVEYVELSGGAGEVCPVCLGHNPVDIIGNVETRKPRGHTEDCALGHALHGAFPAGPAEDPRVAEAVAWLGGRKALTDCVPLYEILGVEHPKFRCKMCLNLTCTCQDKPVFQYIPQGG